MEQRLKNLRIIHMALTAPPIFMLGVFYFLRQSGQASNESPAELLYVAIGLAVFAPVLSHFISGQLFAARIVQIKENLSINEEQTVAVYQSPKIVQWALLEGPAFFQGVVFFLTGELLLLGLGGLLIAILAIQGPSLADLKKRLDISDTRLRQIQAASG
ncbi:MAG: hypothetical protein NXI24_15260 [bacterium]|nr:hypothetical protein [bacterium]